MHIYNSAIVRVPAGLVVKGGGSRRVNITVRYGVIQTPRAGLCLVDTGYGPAVTSGPRSVMLRAYAAALRPKLIEETLPEKVAAKLGTAATDIKTIILTHFHADHTAGLRSFPNARILTWGSAAQSLRAMSPARAIANGIFPELLPQDFYGRIVGIETFARRSTATALGDGFDIFGDASYLAIPLPGHAEGHFGVFWIADGSPVLYATDAAWLSEALIHERPAPIATHAVFHDTAAARTTRQMIRDFAADGGTVILCHDIAEPSP